MLAISRIIQWKRDQGSLSNRAGTRVSMLSVGPPHGSSRLLSPRNGHDNHSIPGRKQNKSPPLQGKGKQGPCRRRRLSGRAAPERRQNYLGGCGLLRGGLVGRGEFVRVGRLEVHQVHFRQGAGFAALGDPL